MVTTPEDSAITLSLAALLAEDDDSPFPQSHTLMVAAGAGYQVLGLTVTPAADYFGPLNVTVTISDGTNTSDPFALLIDVTPVNDPPIITGQSSVGAQPNVERTLLLTELQLTDVDNSNPADFTLNILDGLGYAHTANTFTLDSTAQGTVLVGVTVQDLTDASIPFELLVDVLAVCGDARVDSGETCDTAIASGTGACPSSCSDGRNCTRDTLVGQGTCGAACVFEPVTNPMNGDGCCPPGGLPINDTDCVLGCGNGLLDPGETCDTNIPVGPGRCPTSCSDGQACTADTLTNGDTCTAMCSFPTITAPASGDGCCPPTGNAVNDLDCPPVCGNLVVEPGEQCDDGSQDPNGGCANPCGPTPTAFRMVDLDLRDPHMFVDLVGCRDFTDTPLVGFAINGDMQADLQTDSDADGQLDQSLAIVFRPASQVAQGQPPTELHFPSCTPPLASTACQRNPASQPPVLTTSTNQSVAGCLQPLPGTVRPYSPAVTSTGAPCFSTNTPATVTIVTGGIPIPLHDARVAATYVGVPASALVNGLLMGFLTEADANATIIPATMPLVGGLPLSSLLPGGMGNCAAHSDLDIHNGVRGWWIYYNFTAVRVPWQDTP